MSKVGKIIRTPFHLFTPLAMEGCFNWLPDKPYLKLIYRAQFGQKLNLDNPVTFNEKLQWIKLYDRKPLYTQMVDKYEAKKFVASIIGEEYIIPTLGVWEKFDEIDFDSLPNQFVLKCTHDSGGLVVCKDKTTLNILDARQRINDSLRTNYFLRGREWPYKNVKPRIIAEKYMEDSKTCEQEVSASVDRVNEQPKINGLLDYKFYCFNGEPKFLYVGYANIRNGQKNDLLSFYDLNWNKTPFGRRDHDPIPWEIEKPAQFDKMIEIAKSLSKDIPFLRVDLYWINQQIYFSELTFYPGSGLGGFYPDKWEKEIGTWIKLPSNIKK